MGQEDIKEQLEAEIASNVAAKIWEIKVQRLEAQIDVEIKALKAQVEALKEENKKRKEENKMCLEELFRVPGGTL
jgi:hypothetical protein